MSMMMKITGLGFTCRFLVHHPVPAIPSENSVCLAIFALTPAVLYHRLHVYYNPTHTVFSVEVSPRVDLGKLGATSSTRCPETKCKKVSLGKSGSNSLGYSVPNLERLARAINLGPTRHRRPVAQERIPSVLEMEEPIKMAGKT
jgi:hypothetical protein